VVSDCGLRVCGLGLMPGVDGLGDAGLGELFVD
jgi:hypothetical protein